jgi:DNA-binding CsgD family transcriptional regulator
VNASRRRSARALRLSSRKDPSPRTPVHADQHRPQRPVLGYQNGAGEHLQPRPSAAGASVHPSEMAVLRLLVDGYTDGKLAHRLEMAGATVEQLVARIRAKLGPWEV